MFIKVGAVVATICDVGVGVVRVGFGVLGVVTVDSVQADTQSKMMNRETVEYSRMDTRNPLPRHWT